MRRFDPFSCAEHDGHVEGCRLCLRDWLDRSPPAGVRGEGTPWRRWFEGGEYLGQRSARTGPDGVASAQKCICDQCQKSRVEALAGDMARPDGTLEP